MQPDPAPRSPCPSTRSIILDRRTNSMPSSPWPQLAHASYFSPHVHGCCSCTSTTNCFTSSHAPSLAAMQKTASPNSGHACNEAPTFQRDPKAVVFTEYACWRPLMSSLAWCSVPSPSPCYCHGHASPATHDGPLLLPNGLLSTSTRRLSFFRL